ncbi:MAG: nicotinamide mononucleotide transporter [Bacteroidales bacterium]|nr:nicotinamide mononucleotide transporter [Bacteroidales bacterium]
MNINLLEILAAIVGLIYLILEYKASVWLWLFGVISPILYIYEFYINGVYANMAIQIYYIIACIYGIMVWKGMIGKKQNKEKPSIASIPRRYVFPTIVTTLVLCIAIPLVLKAYTDSDVWLFDGISTALSIVGMWMLAKKYYQQWILWIIVEPLIIITSLQAQMYATAILYVVYTVIAIMGYIKWKREAIQQ